MRGLFGALFVLVFSVVFTNSFAANNNLTSYADLVEKIMPSVVTITSTKIYKPSEAEKQKMREFNELFNFFGIPNSGLFDNAESKTVVVGSGFFISKEGLVVTNYHVVENATSIEVKTFDNTSIKMKIVGFDKYTDLVVLKPEGNTDNSFVYAKFGDSNKVRVGDPSLVIGNPFGLGNSVTSGIISARGRNITDSPYSDYIQTDAAINRGNSGGPLFNVDGDVIGINTAIYSNSGGNDGIGFAIPSSVSQSIVGQILKNGRVSRGWIGVGIADVSEKITESTGYKSKNGAFVSKVYDGSPAQKAGIKEMDIITSFNKNQITSFNQLPKYVASVEVGKVVVVDVWRFGASIPLKIKIEELKNEEMVSDSDSAVKRDSGGVFVKDLPSKEGVSVLKIENKTILSEGVLREGDIIIQIGSLKITNSKVFKEVFDFAIKSGKNAILMKIKRGDNVFVSPVSIKD